MDRRDALKALVLAPGLSVGAASLAAAQEAARRPAAASRTVRINGADLNYSIAGEANDHPLIVLHGARGRGTHGRVFAAYRPLADRYRVIGFDMRGHGGSSVTGPFTFDQICDDIEQLRLTLGGGRRMVLHGGSFGGFIALAYAMRYPEGLSHLILRGTAPSYRQEEAAIANFEARAAAKAPMATREMLDKVFSPTIADDAEFMLITYALSPMYLPDGVEPDHNALMESARRGVYRAQVHNDLYRPEVWRAFDVEDRLPDIAVPTLVICGERDWICDPRWSRLMASRIPDAKLVVVPGADHAVPGGVLERESRIFLAANPGRAT